MTSASSASSTPPLPNRITSCFAQEYELSVPHWLMRMSCDCLLIGRSVVPKPRRWMYFCASVTQ